MDGIHDLGGKHGYGQVEREPDEPVFHSRWEAKVFAMSSVGARTGAWNNTDRFRHAIERIDPVAYLTHGYYGRWLGGIEAMLIEAGIVDREELTRRAAGLGGHQDDLVAARPNPHPQPLSAVTDSSTAKRTRQQQALFHGGQRVRTVTDVKAGHTRLPAYARGKEGKVTALHNAWVYPDSNAQGHGEDPQHLYTVTFDAVTLWGSEAEADVFVSLDLFEPYLKGVDHER